MKKTLSILMAVILLSFNGFSQVISYDVSTIPDSLKKDVSVIKRYENTIFEVEDLNSATYTVHTIETVLNKDGAHALNFVSYSDKFHKLGDVDIKLFDAKGKVISKYKRKDVRTISLSDESLVDDGQTHYLVIEPAEYPVTIETEYRINYRGILRYPSYNVLRPGLSLEQSNFTVKVPRELGLRYKEKNIKLPPQITEDGKYQTYKWSVKNLAPITYEEGAAGAGKSYPHILLAPNKFKIDDYEGDMSTWKNFGIWYNAVTKETDKLSDARKKFYADLVKNDATEKEKVQHVYSYLQDNFRYVSIQLGIGGQKPLSAEFTDDKKYGDCKGLSNYVRAVLKTMGIKSYLVLINREIKDEPVDSDFACDQFNHVILCVPFAKDSVWLECTSNSLPFGSLDMSTQNRNALVVTETGGVLIPTPSSRPGENVFYSSSKVQLDEKGGGEPEVHLKATGLFKEELDALLKDEKKDEQKRFLVTRLGLKQPDDFSISIKSNKHELNTDISLVIEKIPEFTAGSKMFLAPQMSRIWNSKLPKAENRKSDYYFYCPFEKRDTTIYKLPAGYVIDALPAEQKLTNEYANFYSKSWFNESEKAVYTYTELSLKQHRIPAAKYAGIKTFFDGVYSALAQRVVIRKE